MQRSIALEISLEQLLQECGLSEFAKERLQKAPFPCLRKKVKVSFKKMDSVKKRIAWKAYHADKSAIATMKELKVKAIESKAKAKKAKALAKAKVRKFTKGDGLHKLQKKMHPKKPSKKAKKTEKKSDEALDKVKTYLNGRMHNVTESLAKLDTAEKKREAELKETLDKRAPVKDGKDAIAKGRSLLNILMKKEHRNFEKTRATLKNELKELTEAEKAIEKGDASGLEKVMGRMQNEMKSLQAKSHKFLY